MKSPRLILHFDINQTLIMTDHASGKTMEDIVSSCIMNSIHGTMLRHPKDWKNVLKQIDSKENKEELAENEKYSKELKIENNPESLSDSVENIDANFDIDFMVRNWIENRNNIERVEFDVSFENSNENNNVNYTSTSNISSKVENIIDSELIHDPNSEHYMSYETYIHQFVFPYEIHPHGTPKEVVLAERQDKKKLRLEITRKFLSHFPHHQDLYSTLMKGLKYEDGSNVFIIPAFFELIFWLESNNFDYSIVFRTFGDDIKEVTEEFNLFCSGKHPHFPHNIESLKKKAIQLEDPNSFGYFHRSEEIVSLVLGEKVQPTDINFKFDNDNVFKLIQGEKNIYSYVKEISSTGKSIALRDFYPYWSWKREIPEAGKVFLFNKTDTDVHQIFFDDNIFIADEHGIVDLRDVESNKHMRPLENFEGLYLKHVTPINSIIDKNFFINAVKNAQKRFENEHLKKDKV